MNEFIKEITRYNLCSWYILPLLGLSPKSFGKENFLNSYLVRDKDEIAVLVADVALCRGVMEHKNYLFQVVTGKYGTFILYGVPAEWKRDYELFLLGKYSKLSSAAKDLIRANSGLTYEAKDTQGNRITDARLMALEKHPVLRKTWEEILGDDINLPDEWLSTPGEESFITLEGESQ